ncbi:nuclear transport factor 2 family protein [Aeromicrobium sp. NPDC092404]|uniref:nuclear transport factor 2 family protein n=1 Tax=Aeromicrobium sp. NPDC092404 TaxID=3154976 RepID=UPI0034413E8A
MDPEDLVAAYLEEVSNEPEGERRRAAIQRLFAEGVRYVDQDGPVDGREAFIERIHTLATMMRPTSEFSLTKPVKHVDDAVIFHWQLGVPGEDPSLAGMNFAIVEDGRIVRLYAVLD